MNDAEKAIVTKARTEIYQAWETLGELGDATVSEHDECTVDVGVEQPKSAHIWLKPCDVRAYVDTLRARVAELEGKS